MLGRLIYKIVLFIGLQINFFVYNFAVAQNFDYWLDTVNIAPARLPDIPNLQLVHDIPKRLLTNNVFMSNRPIDYKSMLLELDKLVMVGYIRFANRDYAFIQTQDDVRKVSVGNSLGQLKVIEVGVDFVLLEQNQTIHGRSVTNNIYLKLANKN